MDETEPDAVVTAGQRLREAREAQGLSIEDIAAQTRIPTRHLASLEAGDWDKLPAPTYSVGFAKNYAGALGLDRNEIGDQLRAEMGGTRPPTIYPEIYEAADPARTMPKGLVIGALALLALVVLTLTWLNSRSLAPDEPVAETENIAAPAENVVAPAPPPPAADGPVVLTATEAVWIEIKDGATVMKQGQLAPGETYEVPATAVAPVLMTGKPEALSIAVGSQRAAPVGEPGRTVSGVSLKATDLQRSTAAPAASTTPPQASPAVPQPAQRPAARRSTPTASPTAAADAGEPPAESNTTASSTGTTGEVAIQP
jgi:cytoskeletal protein RodZ